MVRSKRRQAVSEHRERRWFGSGGEEGVRSKEREKWFGAMGREEGFGVRLEEVVRSRGEKWVRSKGRKVGLEQEESGSEQGTGGGSE